MHEELLTQLRGLLLVFIEDKGLDLVDVSLKRKGRTLALEILVDRTMGGITLDECASVNQYIGKQIDDHDLIDEQYLIEVSSPGLDRPLKTEKDFQRAMGRNVRFHLQEKLGTKCEYSGIIREVNGENVIIVNNEEDVVVPLNLIRKAVQII